MKANATQTQQKPIIFTTQHRSRFSELDPYGHLNSQHYITYFLEHRLEGIRTYLDLNLTALTRLPVALVVQSIQTEYLKPIFGDESFRIDSYVESSTEKSATVLGTLMKKDETIAAKFNVRLVCVDKQTNRSCPWPEGLIERFYLPNDAV